MSLNTRDQDVVGARRRRWRSAGPRRSPTAERRRRRTTDSANTRARASARALELSSSGNEARGSTGRCVGPAMGAGFYEARACDSRCDLCPYSSEIALELAVDRDRRADRSPAVARARRPIERRPSRPRSAANASRTSAAPAWRAARRAQRRASRPAGRRCWRRCQGPHPGSRRQRPRCTTERTAYTSRPIESSVTLSAGQHDRPGLERAQRPAQPVELDRGRQRQRAQRRRAAAPPRAPARDSASRSHGAEASKIRIPSGRMADGDRRRLSADSQPVAWRQANSYSTVLSSSPRPRCGGDGFDQNLFDRALDGAQAEALLEQPVGLVLVERGEGGRQARAATTAPRRVRARARSPRRRCGSRRA